MIERVEAGSRTISNEKLPRAQQAGNMLKLHDAEMRLINSGPMGALRLAQSRSFDIQENFPEISKEDADKIGAGYVLLKVLAVNGQLTESTRSEVALLESEG